MNSEKNLEHQQTTEDLQLKEINNFKTSGDIAKDFNDLLGLIDRDNIFRRVNNDKNLDTILKALNMKKTACQAILENPENSNFVSETKIFAEINAIDRFFNFYLKEVTEK